MKYRKLGRTGFEVSEMAHGLWGMSGWTGSDDKESLAALQLAACADAREDVGVGRRRCLCLRRQRMAQRERSKKKNGGRRLMHRSPRVGCDVVRVQANARSW